MPVTIICPNCKKSIIVHSESTSACAACNAPFQDDLLLAVRRDLAAQKHKRPALLTFGIFGSALAGALFLIFLILAPLGFGNYSINGEAVTGAEFLRKVGVIWGCDTVIFLAISFGLWREYSWTRYLMIFSWLVTAAGSIPPYLGTGQTAGLVGTCIYYALGLGISIWYLFGKTNVAAYYAYLESKKGAGTAAQ